jgi:hypothetical protein
MRDPQRRRVAAGVVAVASVLGLVACSSVTAEPSPVATESSASPTTADAESATPDATVPGTPQSTQKSTPSTTSAEPTFATKPAKTLDAGTVSDARAATASGSGDTAVGYTVQGDLAAVVTVDCSACTGPVSITGEKRASPFGTVSKGGSDSYLMSPMKSTDADQQVWVQADGPWKLTISSWNTVPREKGTVRGKGSRVFWVDGNHTSAVLEWKRSRPGDKVQARYFRAGVNQPLIFGSDDPTYRERQEITTPGVLSVQTEGEWTFRPQP